MSAREGETWRDLGALGAGIGIGFFVYLFVGLGGGFGGRLGRGGGSAVQPSQVPVLPVPPALPPRPRDLQPLAFVMTRPPYDAPTLPMEFRLTSEPGNRPYTLGELVARVKTGDRQDVALSFAGDIKHATTEDAVAALRAAGLVPLVPAEFKSTTPEAPSPKVSGRGWYGGRA